MSLLFILGGLISLCLSGAIFYVYKSFFISANSVRVEGRVIEINEVELTTTDAMGRVNDITSNHRPIVEFYTDKRYRFEADMDAPSKAIKVGSVVAVIINEQQYPGVAKLAEAASMYQLLLGIFAGLGVILTAVGLLLFDFQGFMASMSGPLSWIFMLGGAIILFLVIWKGISNSRELPLFPNNIVEVDED